MDRFVKPGLQARIGIHKALRFFRVSGYDHHQFFAVVFHQLDQRIDGFPAKILFAALGQRVGFIDKEHAAEGTAHYLGHFGGSLADVLPHESCPIYFHEVAAAQQADFLEHLGNDPCHGRFSGAGVAGKNHVQGRWRHVESAPLAHLPDFHHVE